MKPTGKPDPAIIFETLNAYQRTEALKAGIELNLFTAVGDDAVTADELGKRIGAPARSTRILADYLTIMGLLEKQDHRYRLTPDSKLFLDRNSPAYLGGVTEFLNSPEIVGAFENVAETVRRGTTQIGEGGTVSDEHPVWLRFARAMGPMMRPGAEGIAATVSPATSSPIRVLDVAAGHGEFGFAFARRFPSSTVYALDWAPVLEYTKKRAADAGLGERMQYVPGDAFITPLPKDLDIVLIPNFLHHFDRTQCIAFLKRAAEALKPGGEALIIDFIPDEDRVSPPGHAAFALIMLCSTPAGDAYTYAEYRSMLEEAGFRESALEKIDAGMKRFVRAKR